MKKAKHTALKRLISTPLLGANTGNLLRAKTS
jgi:hypothetical protein